MPAQADRLALALSENHLWTYGVIWNVLKESESVCTNQREREREKGMMLSSCVLVNVFDNKPYKKQIIVHCLL